MIFKLILARDSSGISSEIIHRWLSLDLTDEKSTLVQVMTWCRQAPSHYLSQCWPRSLSPYGIIELQWVNSSSLRGLIFVFKNIIFKCIFMTESEITGPQNALICITEDLICDQLTLIQVMAWSCQATSHYWIQCWPRTMTSYGVTGSQSIDWLRPALSDHHLSNVISTLSNININEWMNEWMNEWIIIIQFILQVQVILWQHLINLFIYSQSTLPFV